MQTPEGVVIALNGPWGSGKSSAMNLLKHHLKPAVDEGLLEIVTFNPWWFRGEEALVLAFFRELYSATQPSLPDRAKKALSKLGARLMKAGSFVSSAADAAGAAGAGAVAAGAMDWLTGLIEQGESVEKLHQELSDALGSQGKRYVVMIDDIDRLAPDEALAMFRMVKSVGRLPNVIYLLAFDRALAERVVADRFPSEGPHYLEKIVQASFELPPADPFDLHAHLWGRITSICGEVGDAQVVHVMNLFHGVVTREIRTARDMVRFVNALSITWAAVQGEVDLGDFISLEALRLFQPSIYQAVRAHPELVCGAASTYEPRSTGEEVDNLLLGSVSNKTPYRDALMRLFPKLESVWANTIYSDRSTWSAQRRACAPEHFPTYFRLSIGDGAISAAELGDLLKSVTDKAAVKAILREGVGTPRREGTRAALYLDALRTHSDEISQSEAEPLLGALFSIADKLDVEADRARAFGTGSNTLRLHWLLRALLYDRTSLEERSEILTRAAQSASLGWLVDLAGSAWADYHPREGKDPEPPERCLLTPEDAKKLKASALAAIERAAEEGGLLEHPGLGHLLYRWLDFSSDRGERLRQWTDQTLGSDYAIARLAAAFTSHSWSHGMGLHGPGDLVAKRSDRAQVDGLEKLLDRERFRSRVEELALAEGVPAEDAEVIQRFLMAWRHRDEHGDW